MVMIEKPKPVVFSDVVKGGTVKIFDGLKPDEQVYLQRLLDARNSRREGNRVAWEKFSQDYNAHVMAKKLRGTVEGRQLMRLIYKAVPIKDGINTLVKDSALVMHGEVNIGEIIDQEEFLEDKI